MNNVAHHAISYTIERLVRDCFIGHAPYARGKQVIDHILKGQVLVLPEGRDGGKMECTRRPRAGRQCASIRNDVGSLAFDVSLVVHKGVTYREDDFGYS